MKILFSFVMLLASCTFSVSAFAVEPSDVYGFWKVESDPYNFESGRVKFPDEEKQNANYSVDGNSITMTIGEKDDSYRLELIDKDKLKITYPSGENAVLMRIDKSEWTSLTVFSTKKMRDAQPTPIEF